MTVKQRIKDYISINTTASIKEVADALKTTKNVVKKVRVEMRKEGLLPKLLPGWQQKPVVDHEALRQECDAIGIPVNDVNHYWYKSEHFSIHVKGKTVSFIELTDQLIGEMKKHAPVYPVLKYPKMTDGHLLVIDPADIHIGKLCRAFETGDESNHKIVTERVRSGVRGILAKAQGFPIDKILFIIGNDILHTDNAKSTTTSGTFQDTDIMWYDAFNIAFNLYVETVETVASIAPVHVMHNPSNHDYMAGYFLAHSLKSWFRNSKNVTFEVSPAHRKYLAYGNNLIGTTHGDGAKEADLPQLMAHEASEFWHKCRHRYFYTHHIHHKKSKDYMSVCVEALRSPSGTDSWHHRNGYAHTPKAVEGFIHHKEFGQICRLTNIF